MSHQPFLGDTSKFKVKDIVYRDDENQFAIATGYWEGSDQLLLACRWFNDELGYPQTFGKPQWLLFPNNVEVDHIDLLNARGDGAQLVMRFRLPVSSKSKKIKA